MASGMYNRALKEITDRTLDITTGCKVMLVNSTYTYDPDNDFVAAGGSSDPDDAEITATNYTRGFGGAGRKAATLTFVEQDANNRAVVRIADLTWTALGGATNDTIEGAILIKEGTSDADSKLVAYFDLPTTPTNGSDVVLDFDGTDGNIRFTT
jgi:hypothetical protein